MCTVSNVGLFAKSICVYDSPTIAMKQRSLPMIPGISKSSFYFPLHYNYHKCM